MFIAIPVTLALTLFVFYLYGYTLNRITLFALIFSIGILVDDAIVVVENIVRHCAHARGEPTGLAAIAIEAVDEVGNPTILATFTVVAAILPMAFVGGLMGPYMRPIPVGATAAMIFSLLVAFIVTPWAAVRLLKRGARARRTEREDCADARCTGASWAALRHARVRAGAFSAGVGVLLLAAHVARLSRLGQGEDAAVRQQERVPGDRRHARTARRSRRRRASPRRSPTRALEEPTVTNVQTYAGTASPYNFNGLVRHYFLRRGPNVADIQVNLRPKGRAHAAEPRDRQAGPRPRSCRLPARFGATIKVAEVPPGPPVLQTLVAEVYGPDQRAAHSPSRAQVRRIFEQRPAWWTSTGTSKTRRPKWRLDVDARRRAPPAYCRRPSPRSCAGRRGESGRPAARRAARGGRADHPAAAARAHRESLDGAPGGAPRRDLRPSPSASSPGRARSIEAQSIYHKNLLPVTYVPATWPA